MVLRVFVNGSQIFGGSGPKAVQVVNSLSAQFGGVSIVATKAVPDNVEDIQQVLKFWSDELGVHLILTTGET